MGLYPRNRVLDPVALGQVTGHVRDAVRGLVGASAEHPDVAPGVSQQRDDEAAKRTGAASDQDGRRHG
jgi:hypothetical protein